MGSNKRFARFRKWWGNIFSGGSNGHSDDSTTLNDEMTHDVFLLRELELTIFKRKCFNITYYTRHEWTASYTISHLDDPCEDDDDDSDPVLTFNL